jgi:hypothetical protein
MFQNMTYRLSKLLLALAAMTLLGLVLAPQAEAGATTPATSTPPTALQSDIATAVAAIPGLTAAQVTCLTNGDATNVPPAGETDAAITFALYLADVAFAKPGGVCAAATQTASTGSAPLAVSNSASNGTGSYAYWWNINGHTASVWMLSSWVGWNWWSLNKGLHCFPGSTAPTFSVVVTGCYITTGNPSPYYVSERVTFSVNEAVLWLTISTAYSYWENNWANGTSNFGCRLC